MSNYYVFKEGKWFKNGEEIPQERVKAEIPTYVRWRKDDMDIAETMEMEKELERRKEEEL